MSMVTELIAALPDDFYEGLPEDRKQRDDLMGRIAKTKELIAALSINGTIGEANWLEVHEDGSDSGEILCDVADLQVLQSVVSLIAR